MVSDTGTVSIRELRVGTCLLTVRLSQHRRIVITQKRPATEMRRGKGLSEFYAAGKVAHIPPPFLISLWEFPSPSFSRLMTP